MKLLRVDASVRTAGSVSRAVGDLVADHLTNSTSELAITERDLGREPLPPRWPDALQERATHNVAAYLDAEEPPPAAEVPRRGMALAATLTDELFEADGYLFTTAMYNFTVPQQVKQWVDLIICDRRAADTSAPILPGRPALLVIAKGGAYGPGTPREGSDHATPWLRTILASTWGLDLTIVELELTMAEHNPAMAELVPLSRQVRAAGESRALGWATALLETMTSTTA